MFRLSKVIQSSSSLTSRQNCRRKRSLVEYTANPKVSDLPNRNYGDCRRNTKDFPKIKARTTRVLATCKPKPIIPCIECPRTPHMDPCHPRFNKSSLSETYVSCPYAEGDYRGKFKKLAILGSVIAAAVAANKVYYRLAERENNKTLRP